jgi:hypothetical protein
MRDVTALPPWWRRPDAPGGRRPRARPSKTEQDAMSNTQNGPPARNRFPASPTPYASTSTRRCCPDVQILSAGHDDERGTRDYHPAPGSLRATSVRNYLISLGIPAQRRATVGYGKNRPAIAGSREETWSQNRRAVAEVEQCARNWLAIGENGG